MRLRDEGFPIRPIYPWSVAVTDLAEAAEVAGVPDVAAHVLAVAAPFAGRIAVSGPEPEPDVRPGAGPGVPWPSATSPPPRRTPRRAVAASRERATPVFLARELVFLAEARRRAGATAAELRPLVGEALTLAERIGAGAVVADVTRYELPS